MRCPGAGYRPPVIIQRHVHKIYPVVHLDYAFLSSALMMAFLESNVAVVALVVALCALIVSLGQLLGQYFATADGYRRCQPSVMGPWAKRTRLRWRWREFRLETMFTTPRILLTPLPNDRSSIPFNNGDNQRNVVKESTSENDMEHVTGSPESLYRTMAVTLDGEYRSNELACCNAFDG